MMALWSRPFVEGARAEEAEALAAIHAQAFRRTLERP